MSAPTEELWRVMYVMECWREGEPTNVASFTTPRALVHWLVNMSKRQHKLARVLDVWRIVF